jgi:hypothetical protein
MLLKVSAGGPPAGTYDATFDGVEATQHEEFGAGLRWTWTIVQGPQHGQVASRVTNATPTNKNACGRVLAGLVGRKIEPREEIDVQSFVGQRYLIVVQDAERGGTRVETVIASPPAAN